MYENRSYDKKMYPKLILNGLKVMRNPTLFTPHWGLNSKKLPEMLPCVHQTRKLLEKLSNSRELP
jgi:hypothetical protein